MRVFSLLHFIPSPVLPSIYCFVLCSILFSRSAVSSSKQFPVLLFLFGQSLTPVSTLLLCENRRLCTLEKTWNLFLAGTIDVFRCGFARKPSRPFISCIQVKEVDQALRKSHEH